MEVGRNNKVLLHAWKKTGQHWFMFTLANYHFILTKDIQEPLDWVTGARFGRKGVGYTRKEWDNITRAITIDDFMKEYPTMLRSEANWERNKKYHESFDKVIYLYRNPFDVLISLYYYYEKSKLRNILISEGDLEYAERPLNVELNLKDLWQYIKDYILVYIQHLNQGYHKADVLLKYEELRRDPTLFKDAFLLFYDEINEDIFQKAIEWGSFRQVYQLNPHHARSGSVGQYKKKMTIEMVEYIKKQCRENLRSELMEVLKIEAY